MSIWNKDKTAGKNSDSNKDINKIRVDQRTGKRRMTIFNKQLTIHQQVSLE